MKQLWEMTPEEITQNFTGGVNKVATQMAEAPVLTRQQWAERQFTGDPFSARSAELGTSYEDYLARMKNKQEAFAAQATAAAPPAPPPGMNFEEVATQAAAQDYARLHDPNYWFDLNYRQTQARDAFDRDSATLMEMAKNDPSVASLMQLSQGQGPAADAAKATLRQGLDAANNLAMSQAASARGGAGARALASRAGIMAGAQGAQRAANQSQAVLAQMALQGIEGLAKQRGENMTMGYGLAGQRQQMLANQQQQTIQSKGQQEGNISQFYNNMLAPSAGAANRATTAATGVPANATAVAPGSTAPLDKAAALQGSLAEASFRMGDKGANSAKSPTTVAVKPISPGLSPEQEIRPEWSAGYSYKP